MTFYLLLLAIALLFIVARRKAGMARWTAILALVAIVVVYLLLRPASLQRGPRSLLQSGAVADGILFLAMIAGMASRYFWDLIEVRRTSRPDPSVSRPQKLRLNFDWLDFLQPLFVSGIVFAAVIGMTKDLTGTSILFSYQNGFFWQSILRTRIDSSRSPSN